MAVRGAMGVGVETDVATEAVLSADATGTAVRLVRHALFTKK